MPLALGEVGPIDDLDMTGFPGVGGASWALLAVAQGRAPGIPEQIRGEGQRGVVLDKAPEGGLRFVLQGNGQDSAAGSGDTAART